jgi:hypothetical protein
MRTAIKTVVRRKGKGAGATRDMPVNIATHPA